MKQLTGSDALWFSLETQNTPMHLTQIAVYTPGENSHGRMTLARLRRYLGERIHSLPLNLRLMEVPFKADYPYWVEDPDFKFEDHLEEIKLPAGTNWDSFIERAMDIAEQPLDHTRPLWEMTLVTGLGRLKEFPAGSFAFLLKVHHAQFDGTNFVRLLASLYGPSQELPLEREQQEEPPGSSLQLLARAPWHRTVWWWKTINMVARNLPTLVPLQKREEGSSTEKAKSPATRFSRSIRTRRRVLDVLEFSLPEIKAISRRVEGATINDVVLAIVGGTLREYLSAHGELPDDSIIVQMPVSAHDSGKSSKSGNRVVTMKSSIHSDEGDARQRLEQVAAGTRQAKQGLREIGAANAADMLDLMPTNLLGVGVDVIARTHLADYLKMGSGVALTNVPGPREAMSLDGFSISRSLAAPFLMDGMGLLFVATSSGDQFVLQFFSTPDMLPDPDFMKSCIESAYADIGAIE